MLNKSQLIHLFDKLGTPRAGRELILNARVKAPVREVQSRGGNVITFYESRKMGREIATESRHIEFAAAVDKEYDPAVLEYYAQPCELKLELIDHRTGEIRNIHHFPDFLVICDNGFVIEEWKSEAKLARLALKYPYRYLQSSDGQWHAPQIEEQLAELGIRYRICTESAVPRKRVENLLHLADYLLPATEPCSEHSLTRIKIALKEHGAIFISELLAPPYGFSADEINKAIADNLLIVDLDRETLTKPHQARLFRDTTLREFLAGEIKEAKLPSQDNFVFDIAAGARFAYGTLELTIALVGETHIVCSQPDGKTVNLEKEWVKNAIQDKHIKPISNFNTPCNDISRYSQKELDAALQRQQLLQSSSPGVGVSERTQRRWLARQHIAFANGASEVLALVPRSSARGNRTQRLNERQQELLQRITETKWRSHEARNYKACYRELLVACEAAEVKAPSYPTLIACIKAEETNHDTRVRFGKRMAYQQSEFVDFLYADTPIHGSRPFQYVHIDHTQLDIELISSRSGKPIGRPWLTLAVDAWSRRIVALYLTFDSPSYHSVMMVIRDMVKRYQRLPEFIVVDNGRDFMSDAFESFLQVMGTHLRFRPAGQPRHGAVLERLFGRAHSEYIHNLAGNTKVTKNVRMTTGKHMPVNFAEWTLETMYFGIEYWATEFYDQERHPSLDCSPREAFIRGQLQSGTRPQRMITFNQDFLIATCPPIDREGVRRVNRQSGVKVNGMLYWHPEFRTPRVARQRLPVRYDPWDASSVYVRLKDRWLHAVCRNLGKLGQLTELERRALTEEYIHRSNSALDSDKSAQRLREFMRTFKPEGALATALERQQENKSLYNGLQLSAITPVTPFQKTRLNEDTSLADSSTATRPFKSKSSSTPTEAKASDSLPDFDTF